MNGDDSQAEYERDKKREQGIGLVGLQLELPAETVQYLKSIQIGEDDFLINPTFTQVESDMCTLGILAADLRQDLVYITEIGKILISQL